MLNNSILSGALATGKRLPKEPATNSNGNNNSINSNRSPQHERKRNTSSNGGGRSSPNNIPRKNSNNSSSRSPNLTNKTYHTTNSFFEKAALFGQKEESVSLSSDKEEKDHRHEAARSVSSSPPPNPSPVIKNHLSHTPFGDEPTILINGEAWDGKTDISDEEGEEDDSNNTSTTSATTSTLDHNLFINSNGLIQRGDSTECMAEGEGLHQGFVDTESTFFIKTEEPFDTCSLRIEIKGPKQKPVKITTHLLDENLCSFNYWARRVGYYLISVKWKGEHVVGSPFDVTIMAISKSNHKKQ